MTAEAQRLAQNNEKLRLLLVRYAFWTVAVLVVVYVLLTTTGRPILYSLMGQDCSNSCEGHEAGWAWAQENSVHDSSYSGGNSDSFRAGVKAYAVTHPF